MIKQIYVRKTFDVLQSARVRRKHLHATYCGCRVNRLDWTFVFSLIWSMNDSDWFYFHSRIPPLTCAAQVIVKPQVIETISISVLRIRALRHAPVVRLVVRTHRHNSYISESAQTTYFGRVGARHS